MEHTHPRDWRELIGFPRTPLQKLTRDERLLIKKALQVDSSKLDPPIALRMALCSGAPVRSEWLKPAVIDLALETNDIVRHFDKLTMSRKVIDAAALSEILAKRAEKSPIPVLHALKKAVLPKRSKRKPTLPTAVDEATALQFVKIVSTLVPQLLQGDLNARKKHIGQELLEVIHAVAKSSREPVFAGKAVEFVRALEKYLGWTDMEKEPLQEMRNSILLLPAELLPDVLNRGCIVGRESQVHHADAKGGLDCPSIFTDPSLPRT